MKAFCVYRGGDFPSSRIRILQMQPELEARGVACTVSPYPRSHLELARLCRDSRQADVIWLQKKLPSLADAIIWRWARAPIIFDFDDAIRFRLHARRGSYRSVTRERRFRRITRLAAAFTCGNRYLASLVEAPRKPVLIYPSPVPVHVPVRSYADRRPRRVLGWIGDARNLGSLRRIGAALATVAGRHPMVLRVISNGRLDLPGVEVENVAWSLDQQDSLVADLDIGLMPLDADSPYDRGKCAYKLLQYMAAGVVSAADAVGMNAEVIRDEENGRLVPHEQAWAAVLDDLLDSSEDCLRAMGAAARRTAEAGFTYGQHADALAAFFRQVSGRYRVRTASRHDAGPGGRPGSENHEGLSNSVAH